VKSELTERARRLFVASEAMAFGHGGIAAASRATGMAASVIGRGIAEVRAIESGAAPAVPPNRSRRPVGGRKKTTDKDPTLLADLQALVEVTTRGDPESPLLWTARSQRNIVAALTKQGHRTSMKMVSCLLKDLGYSLQANRKRLEGAQHPDRDAQFEHINETLRRQLEAANLRCPSIRRNESSWGRSRTVAASSARHVTPSSSTCMTSSTRSRDARPVRRLRP
jgi:hypothetical protein